MSLKSGIENLQSGRLRIEKLRIEKYQYWTFQLQYWTLKSGIEKFQSWTLVLARLTIEDFQYWTLQSPILDFNLNIGVQSPILDFVKSNIENFQFSILDFT